MSSLWDQASQTKRSTPPTRGTPVRKPAKGRRRLIQPSVTTVFMADMGCLFFGFVRVPSQTGSFSRKKNLFLRRTCSLREEQYFAILITKKWILEYFFSSPTWRVAKKDRVILIGNGLAETVGLLLLSLWGKSQGLFFGSERRKKNICLFS